MKGKRPVSRHATTLFARSNALFQAGVTTFMKSSGLKE